MKKWLSFYEINCKFSRDKNLTKHKEDEECSAVMHKQCEARRMRFKFLINTKFVFGGDSLNLVLNRLKPKIV